MAALADGHEVFGMDKWEKAPKDVIVAAYTKQ